MNKRIGMRKRAAQLGEGANELAAAIRRFTKKEDTRNFIRILDILLDRMDEGWQVPILARLSTDASGEYGIETGYMEGSGHTYCVVFTDDSHCVSPVKYLPDFLPVHRPLASFLADVLEDEYCEGIVFDPLTPYAFQLEKEPIQYLLNMYKEAHGGMIEEPPEIPETPEDPASGNIFLKAAIGKLHRHPSQKNFRRILRELADLFFADGRLLLLGQIFSEDGDIRRGAPGAIVIDGTQWIGAFTGKDTLGSSLQQYKEGTLLSSSIDLLFPIVFNDPDVAGLVIDPETKPVFLTKRNLLILRNALSPYMHEEEPEG